MRHPELIFEICSYTDQRGSDSSNLKLSQARASIVKNYLVEHGVSENRLAAVGYGELYPIVEEAEINSHTDKAKREELYQQNRRTEFRILHIYPSVFSLADTIFSVGSILRCRVLFDLNKPTIRPESFPILDSLAAFLLEHSNLSIEIRGHTDTRVSDKYSTCLSCNRAKAIVEYLKSKGVAAERMRAIGFQGKAPLITNNYILKRTSKEAQEELHRLNRRIEIKILEVK